MSVERVVMPPGSQPVIGEVTSDQATILISRVMRVELSSPTIQVTDEYPAVQSVDVNTIGAPTFWAWSVVAPERPGNHILTLKIFLGEEPLQPSWLRGYQVEVVEFSPTPGPTTMPSDTPDASSTPTLTPTPTLPPPPTPTPTMSERIRRGMLDNAAEIFISVVSLVLSGIAWLVGASYRWRKRRKTKLADLRNELAAASEEGAVGAHRVGPALTAEISELEGVRWWQFWKWDD
jgi:hypothetical protein